MQMVRIQVQLPREIKRQLDARRAQGTTASGFIRHLVERELQAKPVLPRKRQRRVL